MDSRWSPSFRQPQTGVKEIMVLFCREKGERLTITVHVQPRARKSEIVGVHGDVLKVKVAAPPVDGAANDELILLFSKFFGIARSRVQIFRGGTSRHKVIEVSGVTESELTSLLLQKGLLTIKLG